MTVTPKPLTTRELAWIARVNKALAACPSKRLGFYTIGDPDVSIYDRRFDKLIDTEGEGDFCQAVAQFDAWLGLLRFPSHVASTAG